MSETSQKIRLSAMNFLARREHSRRELIFKLRKRFTDSDEQIIEEVSRLCSEGLQSDYRMASEYVHFRSKRGLGPKKIKAELRLKGISDSLLEQIFSESGVDWRNILEKVINKKTSQDGFALDSLETKHKVNNFLQKRGFEPDQIRDFIS
ncbi:MAG: regulatory protein RecX [Candidatus Azotimanducaceae bacterium]